MTTSTIDAAMNEYGGRRPFALAIAASVLVHALALLLMPLPRGGALPAPDLPLEVSLLQPEPPARKAPPAAARQMVAPPDTINDRPPDNPHFESDRDNTVEHETVNPGVPNPGPEALPAPRPAAPQPPAAAEKPVRAAKPPAAAPAARDRQAAAKPVQAEPRHPPALGDLFASTDELVKAQQAQAKDATPAEDAATGRQRLALAVAPMAPEWALPGNRGTLDHLPDIQRGNVTLLNTKANEFSPFVRRVGERVFQHLIIRQRRLELQQIMSAHHPVQMRAILDSHGQLKSVQIEGQSGSATMDDTLSDAVNTAAFDNNPPKAAANASGDFEFVFQAQLRAYEPGPGGQPGRIESRLSVGLL
jgi:hypothetical protein